MVNPQTENGYTRIANEILDALCKIRIPISDSYFSYVKPKSIFSTESTGSCRFQSRSFVPLVTLKFFLNDLSIESLM
jgi:hypothetical protein